MRLVIWDTITPIIASLLCVQNTIVFPSVVHCECNVLYETAPIHSIFMYVFVPTSNKWCWNSVLYISIHRCIYNVNMALFIHCDIECHDKNTQANHQWISVCVSYLVPILGWRVLVTYICFKSSPKPMITYCKLTSTATDVIIFSQWTKFQSGIWFWKI